MIADNRVLWKLRQMALEVDPKNAKTKDVAPLSNFKQQKHRCWRTVAEEIKKRNNDSDVIWIFGNRVEEPAHTLLTDSANNVVANRFDTLQEEDRFDPNKGYRITEDEYYPVIYKTTVREFKDRFIN